MVLSVRASPIVAASGEIGMNCGSTTEAEMLDRSWGSEPVTIICEVISGAV